MKLDIAFLVSGMPFDGSTLKTKSLGGSETAGACVARELAARGHRVVVFSHCDKPGQHDGVRYYPAETFQTYALATPHDVCVVQRAPEMFVNRTCARLNLLWCHDLALKRQAKTFAGMLWNVDKVLVVSDFMAEQYREVYGVEDALLHVARNGIDLSMFHVKQAVERDPDLIAYTARPERGLDVLLERILPRILEMRPSARLAIAGYDNQVEHMRPFYQRMNELMLSFGDRVEWKGHLAKPDLYDLYRRVALYVYPTPSPLMPDFVETSCITAMECMGLGLPFVSTRRGALPATLAKDAGLLLDLPTNGQLWTDDGCAIFAGEVVNLLGDQQRREFMGNAGREAVKAHDWKDIAEEWDEAIHRWIDERNDDPVRLAYHFIRRSDIIAACAVLERAEQAEQPDPRIPILNLEIATHWPFACDPSKLIERLDKGNNYTDTFEADGQSARLDEIVRWIEARPDIENVLDVGCGLGTMAVHLSNRLPRLRITGVSMDPAEIEWCERFRKTRAEHPDHLTFQQGTDESLPDDRFDLVLACEVLEHVHEPWAFLERVQAKAKVGGFVYLTVPWGPWEHMSYRTMPARSHLWEFDAHDLDDMLSGQPDLVIDSKAAGQSTLTNEMIGNYFVAWRSIEKPIGRIDMARKLRLQRPRQTVSASIMAGGPAVEETALWCLRSFRDLVDEIVVADTGLTPAARALFEECGARIVPSPSPLDEGFEAPRNVALAHCRMDWVFWIDTDERLIDPRNLDKYLRENRFNGYCLKQHHFSVDHQLDADMPVRVFRRRPTPDGKVMRHYGMLHEHPELGINEGPGLVICLADTAIAHVGYLSESIRRQRFARNLPMLERDVAKYPDRLLQKHFLCRDKMLLASYELSRNGGQITPEVRGWASEVVELYQKHFLGNQIYANIDTLPYYSQACQLLGIGLDVEFTVRANRDGVGQQLNGSHIRFASKDDAIKEMTARAEAAMADLDAPRYW